MAEDQFIELDIRIAAGTVRGRRYSDLAIFRGIPFAQPPVGMLRFAAPRPAKPWDGVRPAFEFGSAPPQAKAMSMDPHGNPPMTSDDWLTVNVWSPDPSTGAHLPVMVWIYGGAQMFGAASEPAYDGAVLARDGGVVVVTFNYRTGMEGYAHIEGAPDNRSLLDQVAALKWVRDHIAAFGGDPDRVTIFGESAGAGSVAALLAMPRAAGLFQRAIAQSAPGTFLSPELAADIGKAFAAELGLRPTVTDLSTVSPARLPQAGDAVAAKIGRYVDRWGAFALNPTPFSAVVDGDVLPRTPWEALADGFSRNVELIAGHNRDEFRIFIAGMLGHITQDQATAVLRAFAPKPGGERAFREAYPDASAEDLFTIVQSDWLFRMPSLRLAEAHVAGGGRAHVYELTWTVPAMGGALGAPHGADLPLVFGNFDASPGRELLGGVSPSAQVLALSAFVRRAWTEFARAGDPGWPAYDAQQRLVQLLDLTPSVAPYPEEISRRLWQDYSFAPLPLIV